MAINRELERFSPELAQRPQIVAANKADLATPEQIEEFTRFIQEQGLECYPISAATTKGAKDLADLLAAKLAQLPPIRSFEAQPITQQERRSRQLSREFKITVENKVYRVEAPFLENCWKGSTWTTILPFSISNGCCGKAASSTSWKSWAFRKGIRWNWPDLPSILSPKEGGERDGLPKAV